MNNYIGTLPNRLDNKLNKYRRTFPEFDSYKHWAMAALELALKMYR